jgi:hypothetical protein
VPEDAEWVASLLQGLGLGRCDSALAGLQIILAQRGRNASTMPGHAHPSGE